jgi:hypothetical protein
LKLPGGEQPILEEVERSVRETELCEGHERIIALDNQVLSEEEQK